MPELESSLRFPMLEGHSNLLNLIATQSLIIENLRQWQINFLFNFQSYPQSPWNYLNITANFHPHSESFSITYWEINGLEVENTFKSLNSVRFNCQNQRKNLNFWNKLSSSFGFDYQIFDWVDKFPISKYWRCSGSVLIRNNGFNGRSEYFSEDFSHLQIFHSSCEQTNFLSTFLFSDFRFQYITSSLWTTSSCL